VCSALSECDILFGLGSFLFLVLFPCRVFFFPSFIYLLIYLLMDSHFIRSKNKKGDVLSNTKTTFE